MSAKGNYHYQSIIIYFYQSIHHNYNRKIDGKVVSFMLDIGNLVLQYSKYRIKEASFKKL